MCVTSDSYPKRVLELNGQTVRVVPDFEYLGSTMLPSEHALDDVQRPELRSTFATEWNPSQNRAQGF